MTKTETIELTFKIAQPWTIVIAATIIMAGLIISLWYAFLGAALNLLGLWIFLRHNLGRSTILSGILPGKKVTATLCHPYEETDVKKNLLLLLPKKFYGPNLTAPLFKLYQIVLFLYVYLSAGSILWLYSKNMVNTPGLYTISIGLLMGFQLFFIFLHLVCEKNKYKNTHEIELQTLLEQIQPIPNLYVFIKPDAKNISALEDFRNQIEDRFQPQNTLVVNVSSFTAQHFAVLDKEGIIILHEYNNPLIAKAKRMNLKQLANKRYLSDLLPFKNRGFAGISVMLPEKENTNQLADLLDY
jgi:hypothetical protein